MMIPMIAFGWTEFCGGLLASLLALTGRRHQGDPMADITERLRHPVRHALKHPISAIRRRIR